MNTDGLFAALLITTLLPCHVAEYAGVDVCDGVAGQVQSPQLCEAGEGPGHKAQLVGGEVEVGERGQRRQRGRGQRQQPAGGQPELRRTCGVSNSVIKYQRMILTVAVRSVVSSECQSRFNVFKAAIRGRLTGAGSTIYVRTRETHVAVM